MYCPNCKQEYDGKFCPECGTKLIEKPTDSGVSFNLGDANAISGGLHMSDSHNVHNEDRSIHNISNTTSNVTNITQVAAQKSEMELLQEKKAIYLTECKRAYEDNVLEQSEVVLLEECRIKLGLDKSTADAILESVKVMSERNARKTSLNPIARTKLKILTDNLRKNEVKALMDQIDGLEPLIRMYDHDELSRKFFLVLAALKTDKCIELKENSKIDSYWKSFWSYLAYIKSGRVTDAEAVLISLDKFTNYPEDNMSVLAVAGALMMGRTGEAKEYLSAITGEFTPALQRFVDSIYLLLEPKVAKEIGADENTCAFYLVNFFGQKDPKVKAEEERLKREAAEAERKRKEIEEQKRKEEEARRKAEEEWRKKKAEAAERRRIEAEQKRKAEEAARKNAVEEQRKKEAEAAERKRVEAERKRQAEEAARKKAEEERRRKEEEEKQRKIKAVEEVRQKVFDKLIANMVLVEGGTFIMGATSEQGSDVYNDEKPTHKVTLSPFRIGRYEVTATEWSAVMDPIQETTDSQSFELLDNSDKGKLPKSSISWNDCQTFIAKLNTLTGQKFRLPTEAEWEFAARGGNKSKGFKYAGGNDLDEVAWYWKNSGDKRLDGEWNEEKVKNNNCRSHVVGKKASNELGLYDMCGNVWEWCNDWYGAYEDKAQINPQGPSSGTKRVQRGGCRYVKNPARVSHRSDGEPDERYGNIGFRLVADPSHEDIAKLEAEEAKRRAAIKTHNGHEYVDLGLPSGTLWATCNIGASKPEEFGNYFAWGETTGYDEGKRIFDDEHYKFRIKKKSLFGSKWIYTKYCDNKNNGEVDNKLSLDKEDDAAYVQWGKGWRMPTTAQFEELINKDYTTQERISKSGVKGLLITSKKNGNSIFLPEAGHHCYGYSPDYNGGYKKGNYYHEKGGEYWSRERLSGTYNESSIALNNGKVDLIESSTIHYYEDTANSLTFYWSDFDNELSYHVSENEIYRKISKDDVRHRCFGYSIRPVLVDNK